MTTITPLKRAWTKYEGGLSYMALTVTKMTRVFQFNGIRLPDPNPEMSVDNVKALYSAQYPELTTAVVNGPEAVGDKLRYTFDRAIGSKG
jgi:PRTRC genetic system protein C